jgi:hypothetical protein
VRNCPWSGDLWGLYLRYIAQLEDQPFDTLTKVKSDALSIPWLSQQPTELVKLYLAWICICRMRITDWDEQIEETDFLEEELDECLGKVNTGTRLLYVLSYICSIGISRRLPTRKASRTDQDARQRFGPSEGNLEANARRKLFEV